MKAPFILGKTPDILGLLVILMICDFTPRFLKVSLLYFFFLIFKAIDIQTLSHMSLSLNGNNLSALGC